MTYMNVAIDDLKKVLSEEDITWASNVRIPYNDNTGLWIKLHLLQQKVSEAIASGLIEQIQSHFESVKSSHYIVSDCLDGVVNPTNGKHYDSRSKYYADVKASGSHIVEAGEHGKKRQQDGDYNVSKELKEALQQHLR